MKVDSLEKKLVREYGITDDLFEAGYILSDGTPVDFSGRSQASGYVRLKDRYVPKRGPDRVFGRNLDHRQFPEGFSDLLGTGNGSEMMREFLRRTGALRVNSSAGFSVYTVPSVEAVSSFLRRWRASLGSQRTLHVDALTSDGSGAMDSRELAPDLEEVMSYLEDFYSRRHPSMGSANAKEWSPSGRKPGDPLLDSFVEAYLEAALFAESDDQGRPLDRHYELDDFSDEAVKRAIKDCREFREAGEELLRQHGSDIHNGHDFWLSRNGHGAGFFDRGYGPDNEDGDRLQDLAENFGELNIYVDDNKKLRFMPEGGSSMGSIHRKKRSPKDWSPSGRRPPGEPISLKFVQQYLETALWSSTDLDDPDDNPLDKNYSIEDFAPEAITQAIKECNDFMMAAEDLLREHGDDEQNGHDFWLTRNGHGAGFWDRGYGKDGDELTALAKARGVRSVYVGDDKKLRFI